MSLLRVRVYHLATAPSIPAPFHGFCMAACITLLLLPVLRYYLNDADILSYKRSYSMSSPKAKKIDRHALLNKLWDLGRVMSTQTVFLHQAIAQSVGLNATDTKCIELMLRGPEGSVTAGWLSDRTGLTTGAITHILDRLEKGGYIARVRDTQDRRKVLVHLCTERLAPLTPKYEAIGKAYIKLAEEYDDKELELISDYLEKTCAISEGELAKVIAANRAGSSVPKTGNHKR
jgi:DNA-binding MarR family transcriptional regulator